MCVVERNYGRACGVLLQRLVPTFKVVRTGFSESKFLESPLKQGHVEDHTAELILEPARGFEASFEQQATQDRHARAGKGDENWVRILGHCRRLARLRLV